MRIRALAAALLVAGVGAASGCGGSEDAPGEASLTVYVSAPLSGAGARDGHAVADGAREALVATGGEAGGVKVNAVVIDSGPGASAGDPTSHGPDPVRAAEAARQAAQDSTTIAYIGELEAETTRTSLPITNDARILQLSPTAAATDLVAPFEGSDEVPLDTQPSGARTFGTLAALDGEPGELSTEAMALVLDSIDRASDPLDRDSVVEAFLATGERESPLGLYSIDDVGRAEPGR
jgi:hypothetical protein